MSKWSSSACLPRPVTKMICSIPASSASSTAYWISGLSTTVSISFGIALVAGRNRVPRPATGKIALRTRLIVIGDPKSGMTPQKNGANVYSLVNGRRTNLRQ
ncbi:hypothetical protein WR25_18432 [Diploscapter pachys]|uniref:Uncharacterized protein n=1 Tax=Diploscapter pachys TaxID=2018661 RepID=A0A2A2M1N6_9BILA|nr:hypothetical protein WR25_18432 [Diploscapter pachys]